MTVKLLGRGPIIVVDDDADALRIVSFVFGDSKVKNPILTFKGGADFLDYMRKVQAGAADFPSIVLLDLNMPHLDGVETLEELRGIPEFSARPEVIMLTSSRDDADLERAYSVGANGVQIKPMDLDEYIAFAESLIPAAP